MIYLILFACVVICWCTPLPLDGIAPIQSSMNKYIYLLHETATLNQNYHNNNNNNNNLPSNNVDMNKNV